MQDIAKLQEQLQWLQAQVMGAALEAEPPTGGQGDAARLARQQPEGRLPGSAPSSHSAGGSRAAGGSVPRKGVRGGRGRGKAGGAKALRLRRRFSGL